jgi:transcription termination factor Rho
MHVFALTGGIATGKSTFCRLLRELLPSAVVFDCDESVQKLLRRDGIREEIIDAFGAGATDSKGVFSRERLREAVFHHPERRKELEALLHPRVRQECLESKVKTATHGASPLFVADVPLLFESGFDLGQERSLLVATTRDTQWARLKSRNRFDDALAEAILAAQMPIGEKIPLADVVFWNEGPEEILRRQILRFLQTLGLMSDEEQQPEQAAAAGATETGEGAAVETPPKPEIPERIDVNEFREKTLAELGELAGTLPVDPNTAGGKSELIFRILSFYANEGANLEVEGVIEQAKENYGMLRDPRRSFRTAADDCYVGGKLIKEHGLRAGNLVRASLRGPRERDKYLSAVEVISIEEVPVADYEARKDFDALTSLFPDERFQLERPDEDALGVRLLDLVAPLGKGQRGLIVAPPRGGKTILLKQIAKSIELNHPETKLVILLLDERPEEVTDFEETVNATVYASTFDEPSKRHAQVSDLVLERSRRLVEQGHDVVILLDSLTRLARGYNNAVRGGPIGSGGLSPNALQQSRKFFGAARNVEEGGSLTIVATCLVETESRMDDIIFEELKGTGNMEVRLDRDLAERRIFPAIHIPQSGTRNDDRMYHPDEMTKVIELRRQLTSMPVGEAVETLMGQLSKTKTNAEFLLRGLR